MSEPEKRIFPLRGKAALAASAAITPPPAARISLPAHMAARYAKPARRFEPSPQQQQYFDWLANGSGNAILEAVAGAGKSTTLIEGFRYMSGSVFLGAYNRSAAKDLKEKAAENPGMRRGIFIATLHGFGMNDWLRKNPQVVVEESKVRNLIRSFADEGQTQRVAGENATFIAKMVSFGKQFLIGCQGKPGVDNTAMWLKLMDHFSVDQDLPEYVQPEQAIEWVQEIYRRSHDMCPRQIDFDDMIYAPIAYDLRLFRNDWVLVDECQDSNPARREMAKRALKLGGRAVFVGDSRQAIYGFTGAGGDSIQRIKEEFNCASIPLTVTYRCPKTVVSYAQQWVSHIQAHESAPEGVVRPLNYVGETSCVPCRGTGKYLIGGAPVLSGSPFGSADLCPVCAGKGRIGAKPWFEQDPPGKEDVILCRYTRPLIQTAYSMIKAGIACKVEGRDLGKGLIAICQLWRIKTIDRLVERLATWKAREVEKAIKAESVKKQQEIEDKYDTIMIFVERCRAQGKRTIDELIAEIEALFADDVTGMITLCTGHKAKGREWKRVYWIQMPQTKRIKKAWEAVEEENILYVIATRVKAERDAEGQENPDAGHLILMSEDHIKKVA